MASVIIHFVVVIYCLIFTAECLFVTPKVMQPIKEGTPEAAIIIVPGTNISGSAYRPLGK